jgi:hypothetical protein
MSMIAQQMGEHIKNRIASLTRSVWDNLGIALNEEDIWNDLARMNGRDLEATFYIKGLDNVVRKDFNVQAQILKQSDSHIKEFKVKFKRPEKEVRFYIKYSPESVAIATSEDNIS